MNIRKTKWMSLQTYNQVEGLEKYNPTVKRRFEIMPTKHKIGWGLIGVCLIPGCPVVLIPLIRRLFFR